MLGKQKISFACAFGIVLRRLRAKAGISQEKLAFDAEMQRNYISLIELGKNQPTVTSIFKLANALEISPSKLIKLVEEELA